MEKCENCGQQAKLYNCKLKDEYGIRYCQLCDQCVVDLRSKCRLMILGDKETDGNQSGTRRIPPPKIRAATIQAQLYCWLPESYGLSSASYSIVCQLKNWTGNRPVIWGWIQWPISRERCLPSALSWPAYSISSAASLSKKSAISRINDRIIYGRSLNK